MQKPSALSLLLFLAAAALFLASTHHPSSVTIDRSFLPALIALPDGYEDPRDTSPIGNLLYSNYESLIYLARTDDPEAIYAVQRLLTLPGIPGGCSGSHRELANALLGGSSPSPEFMTQLGHWSPTQQASLIKTCNYASEQGHFECGAAWGDTLAEFFESHPQTKALYDSPASVVSVIESPPPAPN